MTAAHGWLCRYAENHTHAVNRALHGLCGPVLLASVVGMLWSVPVPQHFDESSSVLNWGTLFLMAVMVYYFIISIPLAVGMLPFVLLVGVAAARLDELQTPLWLTSLAAFAAAGTGQIIGHLFERARLSLFADLNLVAIGPLWVLAGIYRRLGIPY